MLLLKESDYISFFDQFPFSDVFQHILRIGPEGMGFPEWDPLCDTVSYIIRTCTYTFVNHM